jgi:hypothetical protein
MEPEAEAEAEAEVQLVLEASLRNRFERPNQQQDMNIMWHTIPQIQHTIP